MVRGHGFWVSVVFILFFVPFLPVVLGRLASGAPEILVSVTVNFLWWTY